MCVRRDYYHICVCIFDYYHIMCEKPLSCCYLYPIAMKNASALSNPQATLEGPSETL